MKVTVLLYFFATFFVMYLYIITLSAMLTRESIFQVDFGLPGGAHFVMLGLDAQSALDHGLHHLVADVHLLIGRRHWEVAFFVAELVTQVRFFIAAAIPLAFDAVDHVISALRVLFVADIVENEKLAFRTHVACVADAGAL